MYTDKRIFNVTKQLSASKIPKYADINSPSKIIMYDKNVIASVLIPALMYQYSLKDRPLFL